MMATNETLDNQAHEAGDESYQNKLINNRDSETLDHVEDKRHDSGGLLQQQKLNHFEKGLNPVKEETNGQAATPDAIDQSTDTIRTTTTTTSTSTPNSPPQSLQEQHKQDGMYEEDTTMLRDDHDGLSENNKNNAKNEINSNNVDNDDHDGDDEDEGDDDLEEGELKDDDDDDDDEDDDDDNNNNSNIRFSSSKDNNNDNGNLLNDSRLHNNPNSLDNASNYNGPQRSYNQQHHNRRHFSPNQQHHPGMHHPQFPPYQHQFPGNNNYRFPPGHEGGMPPMMLPQMNHHPAGPIPGPDMYGPRGGPVNVGPVQKVNIKCRYYSKTINKCTWGEQCRFRHREDSPSMTEGFDDQRPPGPDAQIIPGRGPLQQPPMGAAERFYPAPPMPHQPYGYGPPYEHPPYGPHQSASPPSAPHSLPPHHWRQQLSPYPASSSSSAHHPESVSPALINASSQPNAPNPNPGSRGPASQPPSGSSNNSAPIAPSPGGAPSPGYSSSPSSSAVYERKYRLAYESAPWNDRGYPPPARYDRNDPSIGYPSSSTRGGYYRSHFSRDPYGREPIPPHHMGGAPYNYTSGYPPNYPSAYRGGPPAGGPPYASHHRYSSSSQRTVPSDARQSKSSKRARDGESSWSDSGSEDSLLNQAGTSSKSKMNKKYHRATTQATTEDPDNDTSAAVKEDLEQGGSGTPPGEPLPEDKERQELLLEKLREIEDLMAKKKKEEDSL